MDAMLTDLPADLHEAARALRKNPGFTFTALITLAPSAPARLPHFSTACRVTIPPTLALAAGVLVFVAILASLVPATRAIRIDPVTTLHYE